MYSPRHALDDAPSTAGHSSAHYFIEGLTELGVKYLFSNLGTDHVSLVEEFARWRAQGRAHPQVVLCPHENVAIHMAAGYAMQTGEGQVVMVHVDAGTANAAMGMHNLFRARVPVMLIAGKAPFTVRGELQASRDTYVHFVQDPFDIGSLVRPYVKWECALQSGVIAKEVLRRAHSVMHSDPPGPVYLTLPREVMAESWPADRVRSFPAERYGHVALGGLESAVARALAEQLVEASRPIVVTSYLGRNPDAVAALQELAELAGVRVYESTPSHLNMPRQSPCFGGFDAGAAQRRCDLGLLLDVDVPWLPKYVDENEQARWWHIDLDPIKRDFPMWGFASHTRVQADCAVALRQVAQCVREIATPAFHERVAARIDAWRDEHIQRERHAARLLCDPGTPGAISPRFVCESVAPLLRDDDIVVNEAIRNAGAVLESLPRSRPRSYMSAAGGGLGYSGGMALGAKLARPDSRVVQFVGDGGFHFSTPSSVYSVAQRYHLPILTIVLDNGGWQAVREAVLRVYPEGAARRTGEFQDRLPGEHRHFEQVGQAFGAHGECVRDPAALVPALQRAFRAVDEGRAAVLNVQVSAHCAT